MNMRSKRNFGRGKTRINADRSVLVGVQELLPRRRRQRFALVVLARNGLSSATECLSWTRSSGRASVRQPVPGKHDGNSSCRVYPRPILLLFTGVQFSFMNNSG